MKLFLQTSSGQPSLVLWDNAVVFEASYPQMARLDYGVELVNALETAGREIGALDGVIVDIGPGRLGSTRTAVAFANGLGFARGIPLFSLNSFLILGVHGERSHGRPCLVLRKAARQQFHWALVQGGEIVESGFAEKATIEPQRVKGPIVVAGDGDADSVTLPAHPEALWSGITLAPGEALAALEQHMHAAAGPVVPLVDTAGLANGP